MRRSKQIMERQKFLLLEMRKASLSAEDFSHLETEFLLLAAELRDLEWYE